VKIVVAKRPFGHQETPGVSFTKTPRTSQATSDIGVHDASHKAKPPEMVNFALRESESLTLAMVGLPFFDGTHCSKPAQIFIPAKIKTSSSNGSMGYHPGTGFSEAVPRQLHRFNYTLIYQKKNAL